MLQLDSAMIQGRARVEILRAEAEQERVLGLLRQPPSRVRTQLGLRARVAARLHTLALRLELRRPNSLVPPTGALARNTSVDGLATLLRQDAREDNPVFSRRR
jgi:hypothetical protein